MANAVKGTVKRQFDTKVGKAYVLLLDKPIVVDGSEENFVSIGAMKGFGMALQAAGLEGLLVGDLVTIVSSGVQAPSTPGQSPMVLFTVEVQRGEKTYQGSTEEAEAPFLDAAFWGGSKGVATAR